jgi:hypothetical protein
MPKTPDFYNPLIEELESYVPDSLTTCLPKESQNSFRDKVNGYNSRVLKQYIKTEEAHLIMQKKNCNYHCCGCILANNSL